MTNGTQTIATLLAPDATPTLVQERLLTALAAAKGRPVPSAALVAAMGCRPVSLRVHVQHTRRLLADGVGIAAERDAGYALVVDWRTPAPTPRKGTRWSATLDEALRRGMAEGRSAAEIGAEIGRTPAAVESRMQRLGLVYANNAARMERMFRERWERASSVVEVTTALKLTRRAASEMAERLGLPPLPVGEVVKPVVPSAPQGITKAQIAWADLNADHPEARLISGMAAEKRRRVAA